MSRAGGSPSFTAGRTSSSAESQGRCVRTAGPNSRPGLLSSYATARGYGAVGSAPPWHGGGLGFESPYVLTGSLPWPDDMPDCQEEEDPCRISARWRMTRRSSPANIAASRTRVSSRPGNWPTRKAGGGCGGRIEQAEQKAEGFLGADSQGARTCGRKPVARRTTSGDGGVVKVPLFGPALRTNRPFPARPPRARSTPYF